jgi:hypothetical protein
MIPTVSRYFSSLPIIFIMSVCTSATNSIDN